MSDKDFKNLMDLAKKQASEEVSPEQALRSLVQAGILDESGNYTPPYADLAVLSSK